MYAAANGNRGAGSGDTLYLYVTVAQRLSGGRFFGGVESALDGFALWKSAKNRLVNISQTAAGFVANAPASFISVKLLRRYDYPRRLNRIFRRLRVS